jgi:hypothetical protein
MNPEKAIIKDPINSVQISIEDVVVSKIFFIFRFPYSWLEPSYHAHLYLRFFTRFSEWTIVCACP